MEKRSFLASHLHRPRSPTALAVAPVLYGTSIVVFCFYSVLITFLTLLYHALHSLWPPTSTTPASTCRRPPAPTANSLPLPERRRPILLSPAAQPRPPRPSLEQANVPPMGARPRAARRLNLQLPAPQLNRAERRRLPTPRDAPPRQPPTRTPRRSRPRRSRPARLNRSSSSSTARPPGSAPSRPSSMRRPARPSARTRPKIPPLAPPLPPPRVTRCLTQSLVTKAVHLMSVSASSSYSARYGTVAPVAHALGAYTDSLPLVGVGNRHGVRCSSCGLTLTIRFRSGPRAYHHGHPPE